MTLDLATLRHLTRHRSATAQQVTISLQWLHWSTWTLSQR